MPTVLICDPIDTNASNTLKNAGLDVIDVSQDKKLLEKNIQKADAVIIRGATKMRGELLNNAPNLKIIARSGVGLDNVDLEACKIKNIKVVNSPEGPSKSVAELVLLLMLALSRNLVVVDKGTKAGDWPKKMKGRELFGKTLGILGSGTIGAILAKYCISLGMKVKAYDIIEYDDLKQLDNFEYTSFDEMISSSDYISVHVPLLKSTKHILNKDAFKKMKEGVFIINAARGGVIEEEALFNALNHGIVAGAGLDVFEVEPVRKARPLLMLPNVIATPHIGAQTFEASKNNTEIVCQKVIDFFT